MPEISIITPVYQAEKFLKKCVDSILSQSFTDWELLLVDDGSTDKSSEICRTYAEQDAERLKGSVFTFLFGFFLHARLLSFSRLRYGSYRIFSAAQHVLRPLQCSILSRRRQKMMQL